MIYKHYAVGPFIAMLPGMVRDIFNWTFVLMIFGFGFTVGISYLISTDISPYCTEDNYGVDHFSIVLEYTFHIVLGQADNGALDRNDCMAVERALILKILMYAMSMAGTVMLLNLLVAMMASTYEEIKEGTAKRVNFSRARQTYNLAHRNAIIPPPLNVVVFALLVVVMILEFLVWALSCGKYIFNVDKIIPVKINYELAANKKKENRNLESERVLFDQLKCCGFLKVC